jgi:hypothetical protein
MNLNPKIIEELNRDLISKERALINTFHHPSLPVFFVVGAPRSGTTLLVQLLLQRMQLGYINNIIARFWMAPYIGAQLALSLKGKDRKARIGLKSEFGFTQEYDGPHEFGYFWKRWFPYGDTHKIPEDQYDSIDRDTLRKEVAALENAFNAPMLFKNPPALTPQIPFLAQAFPTSCFLAVERDPFFNAQSLLLSRERYNGNRRDWFSTKPAEYEQLAHLSPEKQVAGQITFLNRAMQRDLSDIPIERVCFLSYESLCEKPQETLKKLSTFLKKHYSSLETFSDIPPPELKTTNTPRLSEASASQLKKALTFFQQKANK